MIEVIGRLETEDEFYTTFGENTYVARDDEEGLWIVGPYWPFPPEKSEFTMETQHGSITFETWPGLVRNTNSLFDGHVFKGLAMDSVEKFMEHYLSPQVFSQDSPDGMQYVKKTPTSLKYKIHPIPDARDLHTPARDSAV